MIKNITILFSVSVLSAVLMGGLVLSQTAFAEVEPEEQVLICHKGIKTIFVDAEDVEEHLAHGDTLGSCPGDTDKVLLCHLGDDGRETIHVSANSVAAHLAHGDTLGACEGPVECGVSPDPLELSLFPG